MHKWFLISSLLLVSSIGVVCGNGADAPEVTCLKQEIAALVGWRTCTHSQRSLLLPQDDPRQSEAWEQP